MFQYLVLQLPCFGFHIHYSGRDSVEQIDLHERDKSGDNTDLDIIDNNKDSKESVSDKEDSLEHNKPQAHVPKNDKMNIDKESNWSPKEAPLMTKWAADVDPENPHPYYPRPMMVRNEWASLNGLWDFAIVDR